MKTYPNQEGLIKLLRKERKGILRTAMNTLVTNKDLMGTVLDIGSNRTKIPSYYRFFHQHHVKKRIFIDINIKSKPDIAADAQSLPIKTSSIDTAICFNLIEHVPRPVEVLQEISRVLKPKSKAYFFNPYLTSLHSAAIDYKNDFSRWSHATWNYWGNRFFKSLNIFPVSFGPFTQTAVLFDEFIPNTVKLPINITSIKIDSWIVRQRPRFKGKYLLGVYIEAQK